MISTWHGGRGEIARHGAGQQWRVAGCHHQVTRPRPEHRRVNSSERTAAGVDIGPDRKAEGREGLLVAGRDRHRTGRDAKGIDDVLDERPVVEQEQRLVRPHPAVLTASQHDPGDVLARDPLVNHDDWRGSS